VGEENNLNIRVHGEKGSLEWHQREPNTLVLRWPDHFIGEPTTPLLKGPDIPIEVLRASMGHLGKAAAAATRTPPGHPEGYLEAFANIYRNFANHLAAVLDNQPPDPLTMDYPNIEDAVRGMAFIEAAVASSKANAAWTKLDLPHEQKAPKPPLN
jgi:predicted dehydrogenase